MLNPEFNRSLARRGLTGQKLADLILSGRAHLMQVLGGTRAGLYTWRRLARVLTMEEYELAHSFACERRIVSATLEGEGAARAWVFRDKDRKVVPQPVRWPALSASELYADFLREKKIEVFLNSIV